ncbi:hypothetical protein CAPTEDRAFT_219532 [Capitella teleta]|uniref:RING-type E3 ubiquitin transferase n=1 Tax=Capitella teleta TaxID=283909 RepID=R7T6Z5_CAPTE|nr:hypothetical protein CAPTEDRAFT_219532 [Capitella teleta]|eukprot:ELT89389.1 hypothetical protein CAPTEDRAFT_219532 [Capitella teleta]
MEHPPVPSKTWELSLYELHRTPQEALTDNTEIAVSPRSLHSELMCPICLDMLKNTMTTKECLHRFCQECIITALRSGNKECPTCRKKLVSKRSLRPDPNFDALISKIYPSRDEYDAQQERVLAKLKQTINPNALTQSIEEGLRQQALNRAQRVSVKKSGTTNEGGDVKDEDAISHTGSDTHTDDLGPKQQRAPSEESNSLGEGTSDASTGSKPARPKQNTQNDIELLFKPHPDMEQDVSQTRYIKTSANATVNHLGKYLAMRLALENQLNSGEDSGESASLKPEAYRIYVSTTAGQFSMMDGNESLDHIHERYLKANKPLELFYMPEKSADSSAPKP